MNHYSPILLKSATLLFSVSAILAEAQAEPWTSMPPSPLQGPTLLESIKATEELSVADHPLNACDWASPTASHDGVVYYAYIDPDQDISVIAKYPDGTTESSKVIPNVEDNNHHVEPSIGIDADGYLHLVGNLHNDSMNYFRSVRPMDLTEWESLGNSANGGIDSYKVTYPSFFNAPDGTLFIAFRDNLNDSYRAGMRFGAMGRYELETRTWTMLGNEVTELSFPNKVDQALFWDNSGGAFAYQGYKIRCAFSPSGRLHVSWPISKNPRQPDINIAANQHTHTMYAYSDDKGDTWFQADGTEVTPPLGADNVEPVFVSETETLYNNTAIAFTSDDRGIVGHYDSATTAMRWFIWDGSQWVDFDNKADVVPGILAPGPHGSLTAFSQSIVHRSWDNGETWKQYKLPGTYISGYESYVDLTYYMKTGKLRFSANGGNGTVSTLEFSGAPAPVGGPLSIASFEPPVATYGRLYSHAMIAGGGDGNYSFSLSSGSLPPGMALSNEGLISGVPAETGSFPFTLQVEDGSASTSEIVMTLTVASYRDLPVRDVSTSDYSDTNPPEFAVDGQLANRWVTTAKGNWLQLDLGESMVVDAVAINWAGSSSRTYSFSVEVSNDTETWAPAFNGSSILNSETQSYPLATVEAVRYVRITCNGSTFDDRANINEVYIRQNAMDHVTPWPNAIQLEDNWKSTWLGWVQDSNFPYAYHLEHGWLYTQLMDPEAAWFYNYQDSLGWFYANSSMYSVPDSSFLYHSNMGLLYYYRGTSPRWFHSIESGDDFQLPLP
jgi:hypothetical protein